MTDKLKQRLCTGLLIFCMAAIPLYAAVKYDRYAREAPTLTTLEGDPAAFQNVTVEMTVDSGFHEDTDDFLYTLENGRVRRPLGGGGRKDDVWGKMGAYASQLKKTDIVRIDQATDEFLLAWTYTQDGAAATLYYLEEERLVPDHTWAVEADNGIERYAYADDQLFYLHGNMEDTLWLEVYDLNDTLLYRGALTDWPNAEERSLGDFTVTEKEASL